jgi:hypothetical protein
MSTVSVSELLESIQSSLGNTRVTIPANASLQDKLNILQQLASNPRQRARDEWNDSEATKYENRASLMGATYEDQRAHKKEMKKLKQVSESCEDPFFNDYKQRQKQSVSKEVGGRLKDLKNERLEYNRYRLFISFPFAHSLDLKKKMMLIVMNGH